VAWPDDTVERWITAHRTERLVDVARLVTWAGDSRVIGPLVVGVGVALAWRARQWRPLVLAIAGWLALEAGARVLKAVVDRPRPPLRDAVVVLANGSLPAAHVARAAFALAVLVVVVPQACRRWLVPAAVVLVAAVGWSRLELGSHWLTDTLVAWPLGLLAAWPLIRWHRQWSLPAPRPSADCRL
jgi:membrane-associated phospholipid phosphatase